MNSSLSKLPALSSRPLVSIVVPSFNQGTFIRATIDSILQQDYRPLEIHVVDGGSQDDTVDVLKSYGEIPELEKRMEAIGAPVPPGKLPKWDGK